MFTRGIDIDQVDVDDLHESFVGNQRPIIRIVVGPRNPTAERSSRQARGQLVIEVVEERLNRPFEMWGSRWIKVQFDTELKSGIFEIVAGQVRPTVADEFFRKTKARPAPGDTRELFLEIRLGQDGVTQCFHDHCVRGWFEAQAETDDHAAVVVDHHG